MAFYKKKNDNNKRIRFSRERETNDLTGNDQRKRTRKIMKQITRTRPRKYHFDFFQMIFLNVRYGDVNQRKDVSGRLKTIEYRCLQRK